MMRGSGRKSDNDEGPQVIALPFAPVSWQSLENQNEREILMSDHEHGTMDVYDQEKTYHSFLKLGKWTAIICIGILVFLAITST